MESREDGTNRGPISFEHYAYTFAIIIVDLAD